MIQVQVTGVAVDAKGQPLILLGPINSLSPDDRVLPIWIGAQEATSIFVAVQGAETPRPLTHDLMVSLLTAVGAELVRAEVTRILDGTFYAELTVRTADGELVLDARPSDAVALASRTGSPLFVAEEVLGEAGVPRENLRTVEDEQQLAEFKDFLDTVDPEDFRG